jgi:AraC-like DNA-binding protein
MNRSRLNSAKTVQNIPRLPVQYSETGLPKGFPLLLSAPHRFDDHPITFLHVHDCLELGCCEAGSGIFMIEGKVLPFCAGDVVVISNREAHFARSAAGVDSHWRWLWLNPLQLTQLGSADDDQILATAALSGPEFCNIIKPQDAPEIVALLRIIIAEAERKPANYRSVIRGLIMALMGQLHRLRAKMKSAVPPPYNREAIVRIAPALQHIASCYDRDVSIAGLAERCRMSAQTLWRLFLAATGCSPQQYLTRVRMQMATALLLESERSILDVSLDVGYESVSSFNRHFRALKGMSPREFRRRAKHVE